MRIKGIKLPPKLNPTSKCPVIPCLLQTPDLKDLVFVETRKARLCAVSNNPGGCVSKGQGW